MKVFSWFKLLFVVALATGATVEQTARVRARREWKVPGKLVKVDGGRRVQIDCRGSGSPTVVLESGLDAYGSLSWIAVHDSLATTTRVCAYSRAGIMWSDPSRPNAPFDTRNVARDLHAALTVSGEVGPWVMVGHSIGAAYVMTFTQLFDTEVAGLVFVDGSHPDQFARYREATGKSLVPSATIARVGALMAWTGLVRALPAAPSPASWPAVAGEASAAFLPISISALAGEASAVPATLKRAGEMRSFGDRPLISLTAGDPPTPADLKAMGLSADQGERYHAASRDLHDDQASWSARGCHNIVANASHYIQFDRPEVVTAAIREVVQAVRSNPK